MDVESYVMAISNTLDFRTNQFICCDCCEGSSDRSTDVTNDEPKKLNNTKKISNSSVFDGYSL